MTHSDEMKVLGREVIQIRDDQVEAAIGGDKVPLHAALSVVDGCIFQLLRMLDDDVTPLRTFVESTRGEPPLSLYDFCGAYEAAEPKGLYWSWVDEFSRFPRST